MDSTPVTVPVPVTVHQPLELINTGRSRFWVIADYSPDYFSVVNTLPLESKPPIMIMGQECRQQRDVGFFSDSSEGYRYSGTLMKSQVITAGVTGVTGVTAANQFLAWLLPVVNTSLSTQFNGILVNRYNSGQDYLSAHSDSESGLDPNKKSVAGISYGATRTFRIRDKLSKTIVLDYCLRLCRHSRHVNGHGG